MDWDMELKDWLQIVIVPLSLGLVTLLWPHVQAASRKLRFMDLINRELREVEPYPPNALPSGKWADHGRKIYLHQRIFKDPSQNRDFLLTIDADFAYTVSQLWQALDDNDANQWLYYYGKLVKRNPSDKLTANLTKWRELIYQYHPDLRPKSAV